MKISRFITFFVLCTYIILYGIVTSFIRGNGYLNYESLFMAHNFVLSNRADVNQVLQFFFSTPFITHLLSSPFTYFNVLDAPFFASIICTSLFNTGIVYRTTNGKYTFFTWVVFLYLLICPINLYAACSGTSFYAYLITLSLLFYFIFNYLKNYTTYHLTLISLTISIITFLDYKLLWIVLLIVPLLFLFTIKNTPGVKGSTITQFIRVSQSLSLRRKVNGRFSSMIVIISFFPFSLFFIYLLINNLYAGDFFFFLKSNSTHWNSYGIPDLVTTDHETWMNLLSFNSIEYLKLILLVSPLFLFELLFVKSNYKIKIVVFLIAPLLVIILGRNAKIDVVNLNYLVIFHTVGLGSMASFYFVNIEGRKVLKQVLYVFVFGISTLAGYSYFTKTVYASERIFGNQVLKNEKHPILQEMKRASAFMSNQISSKDKILCDAAVFYPLLAFDNNRHYFINNLSDDFLRSLRSPKEFANYIIISKENSPFYINDKIVVHIKKKLAVNDDALLSRISFEGNYFKIIRIK